jgi:uncharacterized protein with von Willebrand factor type A (vWA) domain
MVTIISISVPNDTSIPASKKSKDVLRKLRMMTCRGIPNAMDLEDTIARRTREEMGLDSHCIDGTYDLVSR